MPRASSTAPSGRPAGRRASDTADRVLDAAERLAQVRGFNGFSYADVSAEVGVTKASLHYHFPSKAVLGRALIERYTRRFGQALASIVEREPSALPRLRGYGGLYADVLAQGRICLCGMLAAEYETLPKPMQRAIRAFFDANETWLADVLADGRRARELAFPGDPREAARHWISTLEGAMLLARSYGDPARLFDATDRLLAAHAR